MNTKNKPWAFKANQRIQKTIRKFSDKNKNIVKSLNKKKIIFQNDSVFARFNKTLDREFSWIKKLKIKQSPTIFDVGCNVGINTVCYSVLFKKPKIFSFEPISSTIKIFKKNIKLNSLKNVKFYNIGFSNKKRNTFLSIPNKDQGERYKFYVNHALYSIYGKGKRKVKVKMETIDNFVHRNHFEKLDFLKIDVEGHEFQVLKGAKKTIKKFKPVIQLEYNYISKILTKTKISDFVKFANIYRYKILLLCKGYKLVKPNLKKINNYNFSDIIFI